MTDTSAAIWAKSAVGAAAIVAVVALALLHAISGSDALAFVKWILTVWMAAVAVTSGAGSIAKALAQKSDAAAAAQTNAETVAHMIPAMMRMAETITDLRVNQDKKKDP